MNIQAKKEHVYTFEEITVVSEVLTLICTMQLHVGLFCSLDCA